MSSTKTSCFAVIAVLLSLGVVSVGCTKKDSDSGAPITDGRSVTDLKIEDLQVGTGEVASNGKLVTVHYTGWLTDGKKFDSSKDHGQPFSFPLGQHRVIPGWDQGLIGMKVGGKRRLVIPGAMAYGPMGSPPVIPPNATLVFDVELLDARFHPGM